MKGTDLAFPAQMSASYHPGMTTFEVVALEIMKALIVKESIPTYATIKERAQDLSELAVLFAKVFISEVTNAQENEP